MRNKLAPTVLLLSLGLVGCGGVFGVDIGRDLPEQTIPGDPAAHAAAVTLLSVGGPAQTMSFASDSPPVDGSIASRYVLQSLTLSITPTAEPAGDSDCWDFVQTVTVYIESTREGTTLQRTPIASTSAPGCVRTLDLTPVPDVNLKPFADEGFRVITEAVGVPPEDDVSCGAHMVLRAAVLS